MRGFSNEADPLAPPLNELTVARGTARDYTATAIDVTADSITSYTSYSGDMLPPIFLQVASYSYKLLL